MTAPAPLRTRRRPAVRVALATAGAALTLAAAACGTPGDRPAPGADPAGAEHQAGVPTTTDTATDAPEGTRPERERAYLDDLTSRGIRADASSDTTVEVGLGICRGLAEGLDPDAVLDRIGPLTTALAAQAEGRDVTDVGNALVDASRAHLCT